MGEVDLPGIGLWTTSVGSLPKPPYVLAARSKRARGEIEASELRDVERRATKEWIEFQTSIDTDLVVDGEQYRGDMVAFFAEEMPGLEIGGLVRSYGNRYYRKPIVTGAVGGTIRSRSSGGSSRRRSPTGRSRGCSPARTRSATGRSTSTTTTAATSSSISPVRSGTRPLDLERGRREVHPDRRAAPPRPAWTSSTSRSRPWRIVTRASQRHTITHICYGDFHHAYPTMLDIPVDQIDLEFANSEYALLEAFEKAPFTKYIGLGVVDVHSHASSRSRRSRRGIRRSLEVIPAGADVRGPRLRSEDPDRRRGQADAHPHQTSGRSSEVGGRRRSKMTPAARGASP